MTTNDRLLDGSGLSTVLGLLKQKLDLKANAADVVTPVQSDWAQSTTTSLDYIKNKPILPKYNILEYIGKTASPVEGDFSYYLESTDIADGTTHVYSVPAYTTTPELKYQVTTKEYVDNAIDGVTTSIIAPVQSDWNQASTTALDYIKNKPTITDENVYQQSTTSIHAPLLVYGGQAYSTSSVTAPVKFNPNVYLEDADLHVEGVYAPGIVVSGITLTNDVDTRGSGAEINFYGDQNPSEIGGINIKANGYNVLTATRRDREVYTDIEFSDNVSGRYATVKFNNASITGITTPTQNDNPANKKYVDDSIVGITSALTSYVAKADVTPVLNSGVTVGTISGLTLYAPTPFSGDYNDLTNTPTIPSITTDYNAGLSIATVADSSNTTVIYVPYVDSINQINGIITYQDKTKLDGIATGAQVNVQSDWSVSTTTSDAFILNKPSITYNSTDCSLEIVGF